MCLLDVSGKTANANESKKWNREYHYTEYRNNAQKVLKHRIESSAPVEDVRGQIETIVGILCPFLRSNCEDQTLLIKPLSGGLSNHLYVVSNPDFTNEAFDTTNDCGDHTARTNAVLVRIHPDLNRENCMDSDNDQDEESFAIVDRDFESKFAAWLASQHEDLPHNRGTMAPTVYGRFENGRVEEFYQNVRPLAWAEMKTYAPWIAKSMASFHSLGSPPEDILPCSPTDRGSMRSTAIFRTIRSWLKEINDLELNVTTSQFFNELSREWDWLGPALAKPPRQHLHEETDNPLVSEALDFIRRITITHMDCQPLNILISNKDNGHDSDNPACNLKTLRLIDFEYCGLNPIAADIANTFCEYCEMSNLRADYDKEYPTSAQQDTFFWNYLVQSNPTRAKQFSSYSLRQEGTSVDGINDHIDIEWQVFSATLQREVGRFSLLSHLGWAIWSIIKAQEKDGIDFDYLFYARHRMDGYAWAKKKFYTEEDGSYTV